jgi:transcriptional regulator with XRE-family HTH domain
MNFSAIMEENKTDLTVKSLREKSGYTQQQTATYLNIGIRTVAYWESGHKMPSLENAVKLASLYQVSLKTLARAFGLDVSDLPNDID